MNKTAQFTPGPCTCEIVMRTGETLDSSLGDRLCSDISRIQLCPKHSAAPAMYGALLQVREMLLILADNAGDVPEWNTGGELYELAHTVRTALAQAEGRHHE